MCPFVQQGVAGFFVLRLRALVGCLVCWFFPIGISPLGAAAPGTAPDCIDNRFTVHPRNANLLHEHRDPYGLATVSARPARPAREVTTVFEQIRLGQGLNRKDRAILAPVPHDLRARWFVLQCGFLRENWDSYGAHQAIRIVQPHPSDLRMLRALLEPNAAVNQNAIEASKRSGAGTALVLDWVTALPTIQVDPTKKHPFALRVEILAIPQQYLSGAAP